jgi:hypothetical protein
VGQVDAETALDSDGSDKRRGLVRVDLPRLAAADAVEMPVFVARQDVELLAAVRRVAVAHEPKLLEHVEGPVHGRGNRRRIEVAAAIDELATRDMTGGRREDLDEGASLRRPAKPALAEPIAHRRPRNRRR